MGGEDVVLGEEQTGDIGSLGRSDMKEGEGESSGQFLRTEGRCERETYLGDEVSSLLLDRAFDLAVVHSD